MRWSSTTISRLARVRDVRTQLAERALHRAEHELADCREVEQHTRRDLTDAVERSKAAAAQANGELLQCQSSGRRGISEWQKARRRAQATLNQARTAVDEAVSNRLGKELECSDLRSQWRRTWLQQQRLALMLERTMAQDP